MTDFITGLEQDLIEAAARLAADHAGGLAPRRRARPPWRSALLAAALVALSAGTAAGGTLLALRGSIIPAPEAVPPEQTPAAGTSRVSELRAADPDRDAPPWTLRVARSETGLLCGTVGQVEGDRFGLVGLDGRFRSLAEGVSDSCGAERHDAASLIGARVFDARHRRDVRTVVNGVAGNDVQSVRVAAGGSTRSVPLGDGGTFVLPLRGYPEDLGIRVVLRFRSGRVEAEDLGRGPSVVLDPVGGPAWRVRALGLTLDGRLCVSFGAARPQRGPQPMSPAACGDLGAPLRQRGVFFAVRRLEPGPLTGPAEIFTRGRWARHPARTAVWGGAGADVAAISVQRRGQPPRRLALMPGRTFLALFGPDVDPTSLTVRVRFRDGRTLVARRSTGLVPLTLTTHAPPAHRRTP